MHTLLIKEGGDEYFIDVAIDLITRLSYDNAKIYCQFLEYEGYTDWRLPVNGEIRDLSPFLTLWGSHGFYWINNNYYSQYRRDALTVPVRNVKLK